jgi:hypothetical protein
MQKKSKKKEFNNQKLQSSKQLTSNTVEWVLWKEKLQTRQNWPAGLFRIA